MRYGYSSNPARCNLYNREGLPACPFRTDNWAIPRETMQKLLGFTPKHKKRTK